jgi:hypothetical protein
MPDKRETNKNEIGTVKEHTDERKRQTKSQFMDYEWDEAWDMSRKWRCGIAIVGDSLSQTVEARKEGRE